MTTEAKMIFITGIALMLFAALYNELTTKYLPHFRRNFPGGTALFVIFGELVIIAALALTVDVRLAAISLFYHAMAGLPMWAGSTMRDHREAREASEAGKSVIEDITK